MLNLGCFNVSYMFLMPNSKTSAIWPMCELFQVLHFNLHMLLEFLCSVVLYYKGSYITHWWLKSQL